MKTIRGQIACAVFLGSMSTIAYASTVVTLYGLVDGGIQYQSVKIPGYGRATNSGVTSGGQSANRWGLKGKEDLGNGVNAIFTLEAGFNLRDGTAEDSSRNAFNREAYIGLDSVDFGKLTLGRQYNAAFYNVNALGVGFGNRFGLAAQTRIFSSSMVRYDNLIKYETPDFHGFRASVGYSHDTGLSTGSPTNTKAVKAITASAIYRKDKLVALASFDRVSKVANAAGNKGSIKAWHVGAAYDFELLRLSLMYGQDIDGRIALGLTNVNLLPAPVPVPNMSYRDGFKAHNYHIGMTVPIGNGKLLAAFAASHSNLEGRTVSSRGVGIQQAYSLGYSYDLSKRTSLYTVGTYMKNPDYLRGAVAQEYRIGMMHWF
ncbi:porin [Advenella kashmirensis]